MSRFDWLPWRHPPPIDEALWRDALAACPLARLPADERERLRLLAARFLQRKRFHPIEMELDGLQRLLIALLACLPVLRLGFRALRGWQGVVMYPGEFKVRHQHHHNDGTGVVTEADQVLQGEAWQIGPLVLSWAAVEQDLLHPWDGFNVVVHEIAHKLDMLDGPPDGVPPLPRGVSRRAWIDTFQRAYDRLVREVQRGDATPIDAYAATNPGEYFAVVSELHFSDPRRLQQAEPGVAALLRGYYGSPPAG